MSRFLQYLAAVVLIFHASCSHAAEATRFSQEAIREDLRFALAEIDRIHPDLAGSVDTDRLRDAVAQACAALDGRLTRDEAWAVMARLNPVLADGHLMLGYANWRADSAAHLKANGTWFPFEVIVDAQGTPIVRRLLGGGPTGHAGARITRINGMDANEVAARMLDRVHGDTESFRRHLLGQRWWFYHWKLFGEPGAYATELENGERLRLAGVRTMPELLRDEAAFERQFQFKLLPGKAAYLKLGTFAWPDLEQYLAFTRDAFAHMRAAGVQTLVIDIRANGGGDDIMWIDGVMRYVADTRFRWASVYAKRILAGRPVEAGQKVGDVVRGEVTGWIAPALDEPLRFNGRLYVLAGAGTYSSAVLFANTVQDFGVGTLAGVGGTVRTRQSGGTQNVKLPHTGLVVSSPRLLFTRPSGSKEPLMLTPDLVLADDPFAPDAMVAAVLQHDRMRNQGQETAP